MAEKKRTEIIIGFTHHTPSFIEKEIKNMEKADVVLFESPTYRIEQLKAGVIKPNELAGISNFETSANRMYRNLKDMSDRGKPVYGYEDFNNPRFWSNKDRVRYHQLNEELQSFFKPKKDFSRGTVLRSARAFAELTRLRDKRNAEWIKHNLPKFEGKRVYISAGATHTSLYHSLKKELESEGVSVKQVFISKGSFKESGVLEKFGPYYSLGRALTFKTKSTESEAELRKRVDEARAHIKRTFRRTKKYAKTMPWEYALERAEFETTNSPRKSGMLKRIFRKR